MRISYSGVWDDTMRLLRANASLFAAIAGVFLFLPALISGFVAPPPTGDAGDQAVAQMLAYYRQNMTLLIVVLVIGFVGNLALLILALDPGRPTVGAAIAKALPLLPTYFATSILVLLIIILGFFALIIPAVYLTGRLAAVAGPVIVAENRRDPIAVLRRAFQVSRGSGWANAGLILIVVVTYFVLNIAVIVIFGSIILLLARLTGSPDLGRLLILVLSSALGAAFNVVVTVMLASLYRRLAAPSTNGI